MLGDPAPVVVFGLALLLAAVVHLRRRSAWEAVEREWRISARAGGHAAAVEQVEAVHSTWLAAVADAGHGVDAADLDVCLWEWTCSTCHTWSEPVLTRREAAYLAGEHDGLHHRRPTARVGLVARLIFPIDGQAPADVTWLDDPIRPATPPPATSSRDAA